MVIKKNVDNSIKFVSNIGMVIKKIDDTKKNQVKKDGGWENVSSKTCGSMVKKAIEIANRKV